MCFQAFSHFICTHTTIFTALCDDALALDLPFYLPLSCPSYKISSYSPNQPCGVGKYYCAQNSDGVFLDNIHSCQRDAVQELAQSKAKMVEMQRKAISMVEAAVKEGKEAADVKRSGPFRHFVDAVALEQTEQRRLEMKKILLDEAAAAMQKWVISAGRSGQTMPDWLRSWVDAAVSGNIERAITARPKVLSMSSTGAASSSQSLARSAPIVLGHSTMPLDRQNMASRTIPPAFGGRLPPFAPPPFAVPPQFAAPPLSRHNSQVHTLASNETLLEDEDNIVVKHTPRRRRLDPLAREVEELQVGRPTKERTNTKDSPWSENASATKRSQPKKTVKSETQREESSSVRRSARTRGKKISYAEPSDPISRTPSPQKSDDSSFSPPKSDVSERSTYDRRVSTMQLSPLKKVMSANRLSNFSRSDNSLVEKIAEWSRRGTAVSSTTAQPAPAQINKPATTRLAQQQSQPYVQTPTATYASPRPKPLHYTSDGVPSIYPLPPGFRNLDELRNYVVGPIRSSGVTTPVDANNVNVSRSFKNLTRESPSSRDPFTAFAPAPSLASDMDYASRRVSASKPTATMDMATALQNLKSTPDPIKRSVPSFASSPGCTPPSSKRVRLSNFAPPDAGNSLTSPPLQQENGSRAGASLREEKTSGLKTSRKRSSDAKRQEETPTRGMGQGRGLQDFVAAVGQAVFGSGEVTEPKPASMPPKLRRDSVWGGEAWGTEDIMTPQGKMTVVPDQPQSMPGPPYPEQYKVLDVISNERPETRYHLSVPPHLDNMQHQHTGPTSQDAKDDQQFMAELEQFGKDYPQEQVADTTMGPGMQNVDHANSQALSKANDYDYMADLPEADGMGWDFGEEMMGGYGHVDGA